MEGEMRSEEACPNRIDLGENLEEESEIHPQSIDLRSDIGSKHDGSLCLTRFT